MYLERQKLSSHHLTCWWWTSPFLTSSCCSLWSVRNAWIWTEGTVTLKNLNFHQLLEIYDQLLSPRFEQAEYCLFSNFCFLRHHHSSSIVSMKLGTSVHWCVNFMDFSGQCGDADQSGPWHWLRMIGMWSLWRDYQLNRWQLERYFSKYCSFGLLQRCGRSSPWWDGIDTSQKAI